MKKVILLTLWNLLLSVPLFITLSQQDKSCPVAGKNNAKFQHLDSLKIK